MKVDYIIVGLGLAGLAFAEELTKHNKTFLVFEDNSQNSSLVAGGVYNPVVLKRFTLVWNGHQQLQIALPFYKNLERKFKQQYDEKFEVKKVFKSIEDQNNWFTASDKPMLSKYMKPQISHDTIPGVIGNFGFGNLTGCGRIDTKKLISNYRNYLKQEGKIYNQKFKYDEIKFQSETVVYQHITSKKIIFSEGFGIKKNPFFKDLPLKEAKGELITIFAPNLQLNFLLKSTVFVLPLRNDYYKVGATFNWADKTNQPTEEGRLELVKKLQKVITVPYNIVSQSAGIRPTVKDRRPLVGLHPKHHQLAVLNGLGTRGVMIAPTVAKQLYNYLENNIALDAEININRFG